MVCDMVRFEPQLFLSIVVRGNTLAFAADSIGRNQMESLLLCLLSQVSNMCFSSVRY
jgi:xyloglucan O-acetyltransferase